MTVAAAAPCALRPLCNSLHSGDLGPRIPNLTFVWAALLADAAADAAAEADAAAAAAAGLGALHPTHILSFSLTHTLSLSHSFSISNIKHIKDPFLCYLQIPRVYLINHDMLTIAITHTHKDKKQQGY